MNFKNSSYLFFLFLTFLYVFLGTENANIDSWYYASCVKYKKELYNSHHLFYNVFGYYFFSAIKIFDSNIEALKALQIMNSLAAGISLFFTNAILIRLNTNIKTALLLTLFCGVTFGFFRYSTDAETYILPIVFSLGSIYFICGKLSNINLFCAGLLAGISVLFHQLHIWLVIGVGISILINSSLTFKNKLIFIAPLTLIPIVYISTWYIHFKEISFLNFLTGEYSKGNAGLDFSLKSILLSFISAIRTYVQIHGNILFIWKNHTIACLTSSIAIGICILLWFKSKNQKTIVNKQVVKGNISTGLLLAIILQFIFAMLSSGNAEFMVILPFIVILYFASRYSIDLPLKSAYCIIILAIWNITYGLLPSKYLSLNKVNAQIAICEKNPDAVFIWKDRVLCDNILTFRYGFNHIYKLKKADILQSESDILALLKNSKVFTDFGNSSTKYSRQALLENNSNEMESNSFKKEKTDSFENLYGKNYIYQIKAIQ